MTGQKVRTPYWCEWCRANPTKSVSPDLNALTYSRLINRGHRAIVEVGPVGQMHLHDVVIATSYELTFRGSMRRWVKTLRRTIKNGISR